MPLARSLSQQASNPKLEVPKGKKKSRTQGSGFRVGFIRETQKTQHPLNPKSRNLPAAPSTLSPAPSPLVRRGSRTKPRDAAAKAVLTFLGYHAYKEFVMLSQLPSREAKTQNADVQECHSRPFSPCKDTLMWNNVTIPPPPPPSFLRLCGGVLGFGVSGRGFC